MIQDVDETLRRMLLDELGRIPGNPVRTPDQIGFDPPAVAEAVQDREAHVNLYLHDLRENTGLRDEGFKTVQGPPDRSRVGRRQPSLRLDLSYLVTVYAGEDPTVEHRLLSDVLSVLIRSLAAPERFLAGSLHGLGSNSVLLKVAQPEQVANSDPASLWQAMGGRLRPAISLMVTTPFEPYTTVWSKVVKEAILGIGIGTPPDGPMRPLDTASVWVSAAGVVIDQETDRPLEGAEVTIAGRPETSRTNVEGFFSVLNLPAGPYTLCVRSRGYGIQTKDVYAPQLGRPDQLEPAVVVLKRLGPAELAAEQASIAEAWMNRPTLMESGRTYRVSLSGALTFPDGRPAANIPVTVGRHTTTTDYAGVYLFTDLPPGDHTVTADVPGHGVMKVLPKPDGNVVPLTAETTKEQPAL